MEYNLDLHYRRVFLSEQAEYMEEQKEATLSDIIPGYPLFVGSDNWFAARRRLGLEEADNATQILIAAR